VRGIPASAGRPSCAAGSAASVFISLAQQCVYGKVSIPVLHDCWYCRIVYYNSPTSWILGNGLLFLGDSAGDPAMTHSILLVDDNRVIRQVLRGMFEAVRCVCSESEDGQQAVAEAGRFKPDLIVLDYSMPVMNGLEAAPLLRKMLPHTPIIMFTVFANDEFATQAIAAGATAVVSKEQAATHLLPKAESLLNLPAHKDEDLRRSSGKVDLNDSRPRDDD